MMHDTSTHLWCRCFVWTCMLISIFFHFAATSVPIDLAVTCHLGFHLHFLLESHLSRLVSLAEPMRPHIYTSVKRLSLFCRQMFIIVSHVVWYGCSSCATRGKTSRHVPNKRAVSACIPLFYCTHERMKLAKASLLMRYKHM